MKVEVQQGELAEAAAGLAVVGLHEGGELPDAVAAAPGAGAARGAFKEKLLLHMEGGAPVLVVGLGERGDADAERLRVAAALAAREAGRLRADSLAWALPELGDDVSAEAAAEALVTGTILGAYRFERFKGAGAGEPPRRGSSR